MIGHDAPLYTALISLIEANLLADDISAKVVRGRQPTKQGMAEGKAIYLDKLFDTPIGSPERKTVLNEDKTAFIRKESRWTETTLQIGATSPFELDQPEVTAGDLARWVHMVLSGDEAMAKLKTIGQNAQAVKLGIVRTTYPKNDSDQYQEWATFDFVLTRRISMVRTTPVAAPVTGEFHAIE